MVEITLGKNILGAHNKVIVAASNSEFEKIFSKSEQNLLPAIKKQTVKDGIKEYNLGSYSVFAVRVKEKQPALVWQQLGGKVYKAVKHLPAIKVCLATAKHYVFDFAFGVELASYRFDKYHTKLKADDLPKLEKIVLTNSGYKNLDEYKPYAGLANAVRYARDMINEPANALTPEIFAADIKRLEYLGLKVNILDEAQMKSEDFNLALAVAQGSQNRPKVAVLQWLGQPESDEIILGLVGKGVTFDSGGISIKPAANMGEMKQDMAGAAAVVAAMKAAALQKIEKNIVAVVGLVENMPSGSAYRPGDIIRSMSGQTVEVDNTDAEGRLVLADCLTYIQKRFSPKYVVDMATLTGAIVIALGHTFAGLFSNNENLAANIITAGNTCGERVWRMPIDEEFDKMMDSAIADMRNTGGRAAGSSTAACFLQRFVDKNRSWAHIDIAGMDATDGKKVLYPKGASGFGVMLLNELVKKI
jgi:leucyl aminopeptidase